ncbi:glycosyl hydrolase [Paenibacillus sp. MSJ-34]|uniref:glycosyl hydrolase n=1 Tax=Paenibacillus sp. MSJ-34 TaxID=2841529 RepID=UPI001C11C46A|nr:glycosyl hydrolase [Paenibacillus sp. MSJ-34]MBU5445214.1 RICIN domain-containing protein [Paenibacillus sp. MSJ-34]
MRNLVVCMMLLAMSVALLPAVSFAFPGEVSLGAGSYSTALPPGASAPQSQIYKTGNVTGKMQTNDWWSSLAWVPFSEAQYPHPLAVKHQAEGMRIYYPGNRITSNSACICGWMNDIHDFVVGHSAVGTFPDAKVDGFSDWFVRALYQSGGNSMNVSYGHGSPYVYFTFNGGSPKLAFAETPSVWSGNSSTPVLGVTIAGAHYGLFGASGSTWSGIGSKTLTNNGSAYFSVAVLPDASSATLNKFAQYAYSHVTNTQINYSYNAASGTVTTTFTYSTQAKQGTQTGTLFALYPHQWKYTSAPLLSYTYNTVNGQMKVGEGGSFQTAVKFTGVLPSLPDMGTYNRTTLQQYIDQAESETYTGAQDTYWVGKRLGKLASLAPIADQLGDTAAANKFRGEIRQTLERWLKASDSSGNMKSQNLFYYDNNWGTAIGYPDSYGSAAELNDHHFHYGYFVKAAAELARVDKSWADNWGPMVNLLIRDMANWNRSDTMFPYMRNFDPYAGHSWASGHAKFGDGNNNESSSEGMNAWAGMILWGEATGNTAIRDAGIYLYATEMQAINEYWFDVSGSNFPAGFTRSTASMVWGGKTVGDATWWTANPEEVHGINWLPITGASLYLTHHPNYAAENYNALVAENGGTNFDPWEDLIYQYRAISNITEAKNFWNARGAVLTPEAGNSKAMAYHWIYNLDALGNADPTVTADYPIYAVFKKGGVKTYVVYNMTSQARTVTFSDGHVVTVPAHSFSTGNGQGGGDGVESGKVYKLINPNSGKALDVNAAGTANGTNVQIWEDNGSGAQKWRVVSNGDGTYKLVNPNSGKALDVNNSGTANGTNVQIWNDNGSGAQKWQIVSNGDGTYKLINPNSGKALDVSGSGTANGTNVQIWNDNGSGAQKWRFYEVEDSGGSNGSGPFVTADYTAGTTKPSSSQARIYFTPNGYVSNYVDVHYILNGEGQQNFRMTDNQGTWEHIVSGISTGSVLQYWFTYEKQGPQYDSPTYQHTQ